MSTVNKLNLLGKVFEEITVLAEDPIRTKDNKVRWLCRCSCGKEISVIGSNLVSGLSSRCIGCGVLKRTKHKMCDTDLYRVYHAMKGRCYKESNKYYKNYGGRGIKVCDRWLESFENFYEDVIPQYEKGLQIDRIDNDKGYSPDNCRWVTSQQNNMNTGSNLKSTSKYKGVCWSKRSGKWESKIICEGKGCYIGLFASEKEAALAYNKKALELNGEYAYLNKIEE